MGPVELEVPVQIGRRGIVWYPTLFDLNQCDFDGRCLNLSQLAQSIVCWRSGNDGFSLNWTAHETQSPYPRGGDDGGRAGQHSRFRAGHSRVRPCHRGTQRVAIGGLNHCYTASRRPTTARGRKEALPGRGAGARSAPDEGPSADRGAHERCGLDFSTPAPQRHVQSAATAFIETDGYKSVRVLSKSQDGIWRATALRGKTEVQITVDAQGNVSAD